MKVPTWSKICWTAWAPFYNGLSGPFASRRRRCFELLEVKPGERVLLLGAGTGLDLDYLPRGAKATAVDGTPAMIRRLRRRAEGLELEVKAHLMDGRALDFPDASFDAIVLHLILSVIDDPERCIREAARVLRSGGRATVLDKFAPDDRPTPLVLRALDPLARFFGTSVTQKLGPLADTAGLEKIHEEPAGARGLLRIALLRKGATTPCP